MPTMPRSVFSPASCLVRILVVIYEMLSMPVWMAHGVRGDFVDYNLQRDFVARPNWTFQVFATGALPHFEICDEFTREYDRFLAAAAAITSTA